MPPPITRALACAWLAGLSAAAGAATAGPLPIEALAARARVENVVVSPDGRLLAVVTMLHGRAAVMSMERRSGATHPLLVEPEEFRIRWCRWATNARLLCGLHGVARDVGMSYVETRLVAVDADGKNLKVLVQNSRAAQGQFQDRVISWHPGPADTVLVEADEGLSSDGFLASAPAAVDVYGNVGTHGLPAVFELNVVSGRMSIRQHAREPIRHWIADRHGQVRIGWGVDNATGSYIARLDGETPWRQLSRFEVFGRGNHFTPLAISADDPNKAYAIGSLDGRDAVWLVDLADRSDPTLVFAHPRVDVSEPVLAPDGTLSGLLYDTDFPMFHPTDAHVRTVIDSVKAIVPSSSTSSTISRSTGRCTSSVHTATSARRVTVSSTSRRIPPWRWARRSPTSIRRLCRTCSRRTTRRATAPTSRAT